MPIPEHWLAPSRPLPVDELGDDSDAREALGVPSPEAADESTVGDTGGLCMQRPIPNVAEHRGMEGDLVFETLEVDIAGT